MKLKSFILLTLAIAPLPSIAAPAQSLNADQILKEVEKRVNSKSESAKIVMTIGEANGSSKIREIEIRRKSGEEAKVMVRLESPADLRGTALLSVGEKGSPKTNGFTFLRQNKLVELSVAIRVRAFLTRR